MTDKNNLTLDDQYKKVFLFIRFYCLKANLDEKTIFFII